MNEASVAAYESGLRKYINSDQFASLDNNNLGIGINAFKTQFLGANKDYFDDEDIKEVDSVGENLLTEFKNKAEIPRFIPKPEEFELYYGSQAPDLSTAKNAEEKIAIIDKWKEDGLKKSSDLIPSQTDDFKTHLDYLSNSFIREAVSADNETSWLGDKGYRAVEGAMSMVTPFIPGADRFLAENLPENTGMDDDISSMLFAGAGQLVSQAAIALGTFAVAGPEASVAAIGTIYSARALVEGYKEEMRKSGNPDKALDVGLAGIPGAALETFADSFTFGLGSEGVSVLKAFKEATTEAAKRAVLKAAIPSLGRKALVSGLNEAGVGSVGADFTTGYGRYLASGDESYIPTAEQLAKGALVEGILGAGYTTAFNRPTTEMSNVAKDLKTFSQDKANADEIFKALKSKNYDLAVELATKDYANQPEKKTEASKIISDGIKAPSDEAKEKATSPILPNHRLVLKTKLKEFEKAGDTESAKRISDTLKSVNDGSFTAPESFGLESVASNFEPTDTPVSVGDGNTVTLKDGTEVESDESLIYVKGISTSSAIVHNVTNNGVGILLDGSDKASLVFGNKTKTGGFSFSQTPKVGYTAVKVNGVHGDSKGNFIVSNFSILGEVAGAKKSEAAKQKTKEVVEKFKKTEDPANKNTNPEESGINEAILVLDTLTATETLSDAGYAEVEKTVLDTLEKLETYANNNPSEAAGVEDIQNELWDAIPQFKAKVKEVGPTLPVRENVDLFQQRIAEQAKLEQPELGIPVQVKDLVGKPVTFQGVSGNLSVDGEMAYVGGVEVSGKDALIQDVEGLSDFKPKDTSFTLGPDENGKMFRREADSSGLYKVYEDGSRVKILGRKGGQVKKPDANKNTKAEAVEVKPTVEAIVATPEAVFTSIVEDVVIESTIEDEVAPVVDTIESLNEKLTKEQESLASVKSDKFKAKINKDIETTQAKIALLESSGAKDIPTAVQQIKEEIAVDKKEAEAAKKDEDVKISLSPKEDVDGGDVFDQVTFQRKPKLGIKKGQVAVSDVEVTNPRRGDENGYHIFSAGGKSYSVQYYSGFGNGVKKGWYLFNPETNETILIGNNKEEARTSLAKLINNKSPDVGNFVVQDKSNSEILKAVTFTPPKPESVDEKIARLNKAADDAANKVISDKVDAHIATIENETAKKKWSDNKDLIVKFFKATLTDPKNNRTEEFLSLGDVVLKRVEALASELDSKVANQIKKDQSERKTVSEQEKQHLKRVDEENTRLKDVAKSVGIRYSISSSTPETSISQEDAQDYIDSNNLSVTIENTQEVTEDGHQWNGRTDFRSGTPVITVNIANISSVEQLRNVINEELGHIAYNSPEVSGMLGKIKETTKLRDEIKDLYKQSDLYEESVVKRMADLVDSYSEKGMFDKLVTAIKSYVKDKLGMELSDADLSYIAYRAINKASKVTNINKDVGVKYSASEEKGEIGFDKKQMLKLLGPSMYNKPIAEVAVKELLQNSFDALKSIKGDFNKKINIEVDYNDRTIKISDNGVGMTKDIVKKAFLTIGGTNKDGLTASESSGGLGLAKVQFLLGSEYVQVETVRDGVKTSIKATAEELYDDNFYIGTSETSEPNGTFVKVKIPKNYSTHDGELRDIEFPGSWATGYGVSSYPNFNILTKPLIGDVNIEMSIISDKGNNKFTLPLGNAIKAGDNKVIILNSNKNNKTRAGEIIDKKEYDEIKETDNSLSVERIISPALFSEVSFNWGKADIYISENKTESPKHIVLSSGLYQFDNNFYQSGYEKIPYDIVIDIKPSVRAGDEQYPFNNQREDFKPTVSEDIKSLGGYISKFASGEALKETMAVFENIKQMPVTDVNDILTPEEREKIFESIYQQNQKDRKLNKERDVSYINIKGGTVVDSKTNDVVFDLKEERERERAKYNSSFKAKKDINLDGAKDTSMMSKDKPQYHNNTNFDYLSINGADNFFSDLGSVFLDFKNFIGNEINRFSELIQNDYFVGVSVDKSYGGLHIKKVFNALFLNPLAFNVSTKEEAVGVALHIMIHEINHTVAWEEGAGFTSSLAKLYGELYKSGKYPYYEGLVRSVYSKHFNVFQTLKQQYDKSSTRNLSKSFEGSRVEGSDSRSVPSDGKNVSDGKNAEGRVIGDKGNNQSDKAGDVIAEKINELKGRGGNSSNKDTTTDADGYTETPDIFSVLTNNITTEQRETFKKIQKMLRKKLEKKLIVDEPAAWSILKSIKFGFLKNEDLKEYNDLLDEFVRTRSKNRDPKSDVRDSAQTVIAKASELAKKANQGHFDFLQMKHEFLEDKDFTKDFQGDIDLVMQKAKDERGLNDSDLPSDKDGETLQTWQIRTLELQDLIFDNLDYVNDRLEEMFPSSNISTSNPILSKYLKVFQNNVDEVIAKQKEMFKSRMNQLMSDPTDKSYRDLRKQYFGLMDFLSDGYALNIEDFITQETADALATKLEDKDIMDMHKAPWRKKWLAGASSFYANTRMLGSKVADITSKLTNNFRSGIMAAERIHDEFTKPVLKEMYESAVAENGGKDFNGQEHNHAGIYSMARAFKSTEGVTEGILNSKRSIETSIKKDIESVWSGRKKAAENHLEFLNNLFVGITKDTPNEEALGILEANAEKILPKGLISYVKGINELFEATKPLAKFTSEFGLGRPFEEWVNYTPSLAITKEGQPIEFDVTEMSVNVSSDESVHGDLNKDTNMQRSGGGSLKDRTRRLGNSMVYVFNINHLAENRMRLNLIDYLTLQQRRELNNVISGKGTKHKEFAKLLKDEDGGKERVSHLQTTVRTMWSNTIQSASFISEFQAGVNVFSNMWASGKLASLYQFPGQVASNLAPYFVVNSGSPKRIKYLFDAMGILLKKQMGQTLEPRLDKVVSRILSTVHGRSQEQFLDKSIALDVNGSAVWQQVKTSSFWNQIKGINRLREKILFSQFIYSDMMTGAPMMLANMMAHEEAAGRATSWDGLTFNDESFIKAVDEAERFVGIGASSRRGVWTNNKNGYLVTLRNMLSAFSSHRVNNATNFAIELAKVNDSNTTSEEKAQSVRYMLGIQAQSVVFSVIKWGMVGAFYNLLTAFMGDEENEDELEKKYRKLLTDKNISKEQKLTIQAEISMLQKIRNEYEKVKEKNNSYEVLVVRGLQDMVSNSFLIPAATDIPVNAIIHNTYDKYEAERFNEVKESELKQLNEKLKKAKDSKNISAAIELQKDISRWGSQEAITFVYEGQSIIPFDGVYGGVMKDAAKFVDSASSALLKAEPLSMADVFLGTGLVGLSQPELNKIARLYAKKEEYEAEYKEKIEELSKKKK